MVDPRYWERLMLQAQERGNEYLYRKFREKLIACLAYAIQQAAAMKDRRELMHVVNLARRYVEKYRLTELEKYIRWGEEQNRLIAERRRKAQELMLQRKRGGS